MDTVTIGCNLPNGLLLTHGRIRRDAAGNPVVEHQRVVMEDAKTVRLFGSRHISAVAGFGMTHGVDADWFADYMETVGKHTKLVQIGGLFAMPSADYAAGVADERKDVKSGLEPLTDKDPRAFEGDPEGTVDRDSDGTPANTFGRDVRAAA